MSELRQDRTTGRWVIVAPKRARRPGDNPLRDRSSAGRSPTPQFDPACPFCPGNESQLSGILAETQTKAPPYWRVRVVPNKFPALQADAPARPADRHGVSGGYGFHDVIVESPRHNVDLVSLTDAEIETVVAIYRDRCDELLKRPGIETVVLFRNHGPQGGASLAHPHAQVLAVGVVPPLVGLLASWGRNYHDDRGCCPSCEEIAIELELGTRVVEQTPNFVVIVPFAAEHPFETWILPKRHQASFVELEQTERSEFAGLLRRTLARLRQAHDDPPYNFVVDSAARQQLGSPFIHWRLRVAPDLATWGGFELGAGMAINPSRPEDDAAVLRAAGSVARPSASIAGPG